MVVASMKSMKTSAVTTAMKAMKKVTGKTTTTSMKKTTSATGAASKTRLTNSDSSSCCVTAKKTGAVFVAAVALYAAGSTLLRTHPTQQGGLNYAEAGFTNRNATLPNTMKLAACGVPGKSGKSNSKSKPTAVDLLTEAHTQVGFDVSELLETVAKPLERELSDLKEEEEFFRNASVSDAGRSGCSWEGVRDAFAGARNATAAFVAQTARNATFANIKTFANTTFANATFANVTSSLSLAANNFSSTLADSFHGARQALARCPVHVGMELFRTLKTSWSKGSRSTAQQQILAAKFSALLAARPAGNDVGYLLGGVKQAANDVSKLFAGCPAFEKRRAAGDAASDRMITKKFPSSHVANPAPAKFVYNTVVSDGWAMEMRATNGLWTNVVLGRGDFVLALSRAANGAVTLSVNGMELGSV